MPHLIVMAGTAFLDPYLLLLVIPISLLLLFGFSRDFWFFGGFFGVNRTSGWLAEPHFAQGAEAALIGRRAIFVPAADGAAWAELDGTVWPARLPPFEPVPPPGAAGVVVNVADGMLVVRPVPTTLPTLSAEQ